MTRQRAAIDAYAKKNDLQIVEVFEEKGLTGRSEWENRPAWMEMIGKLNGVKTIIVENLTRLARDLTVQELVMRDLTKRGIVLISAAGEHTDDTDPTRTLIRQILGAFSQFEATMISAKLRAARNRKKEATGKCEGKKPFGHYPGEDVILSMMMDMRLHGSTSNHIANQLNKLGRPQPGGVSMAPALNQPHYHGTRSKIAP